MRVVIIPGSADCNRGDQALVWAAIDLVDELSPHEDTEISLIAESQAPEIDPMSRQTYAKGCEFLPALLSNPKRVLNRDEEQVLDSGWQLLKVAIVSVGDFVCSLLLLLFARWPRIATLFLSKGKGRTYDQLRQSDIVVVKGGGFIYAYRGLRWNYYLWFVLYHLMLAQRVGAKTVILPNSFGPFETRFSRWLAKRVLGRCKVVTTREKKSLSVLESLLPNKARNYPDMGFLLKHDLGDWAKIELESKGIDLQNPCVGVTMRPWRFPQHSSPQQAYTQYIEAFAAFVRELLERGFTPVLYVHVYGPGTHENDRLAIDDCLKLLGPEAERVHLVANEEYNCQQMMAFYSHMNSMVCTRFHSCIFSLAQSVPALAVSYQGYKATGIMEDMGLSEYAMNIDDITADGLIETFNRLQENRSEVQRRCDEYRKVIREQSERMFSLVREKTSEKDGV